MIPFFRLQCSGLNHKKVRYFLAGILDYRISVECLNLFLHRGIFSFVLGGLQWNFSSMLWPFECFLCRGVSLFFPSKCEVEKNGNKEWQALLTTGEHGNREIVRRGAIFFQIPFYLLLLWSRGVRRSKVCVCDSMNIIRVGEKIHKTAYAFLFLL